MTDTTTDTVASAEARRAFITETAERGSVYHAHTGRDLDDDARALDEFADVLGDMLDDYVGGNLLAPFGIPADQPDTDADAWDALYRDLLDAYIAAPGNEQVPFEDEDSDWEHAVGEFRGGIRDWILRRLLATRPADAPVPMSKFVVAVGSEAHIVDAVNRYAAQQDAIKAHGEYNVRFVLPLAADEDGAK
jgi:hypothetical protein